MKKTNSRVEVCEKLQEYIDKAVTLEALQNWELWISRENYEPEDWEGDESFTNEVLHEIDISNIDGFSIERARKIVRSFNLNKD